MDRGRVVDVYLWNNLISQVRMDEWAKLRFVTFHK